jgi:GT2 family glycosyltransferase
MNSTISLGSSNVPCAGACCSTKITATPLTVCIVNWNARQLLSGCLASLQEADVDKWAEVIVLDNASTDGSAEMVARDFPWVRLIASPTNTGYSRGNNIAIRHAAGDFILLLNSDTVIHPGTIERMLETARANPKVGAVGPLQLDGEGNVQYEGAVALPTVWNVFCDLTLLSRVFPRSRLFGGRKMGYWNHCGDRQVPAVQGSAMLVRRQVFETVGLLDERMFCAEDMDLCQRLTRAGWIVFYVGSASIIHYGGGSTKVVNNVGLNRQVAFQSFWLYLRKQNLYSAASLTAVVFCWSVAARTAVYALRPFGRGRQGDKDRVDGTLDRFKEIADSLFKWSLRDKKTFRHHLAVPLVQASSYPECSDENRN